MAANRFFVFNAETQSFFLIVSTNLHTSAQIRFVTICENLWTILLCASCGKKHLHVSARSTRLKHFRLFRVFAAAEAPLRGCGLPALATSALPRLVVQFSHFYTSTLLHGHPHPFYTFYTSTRLNSPANLQSGGRDFASLPRLYQRSFIAFAI